jgi:hypothetical protein
MNGTVTEAKNSDAESDQSKQVATLALIVSVELASDRIMRRELVAVLSVVANRSCAQSPKFKGDLNTVCLDDPLEQGFETLVIEVACEDLHQRAKVIVQKRGAPNIERSEFKLHFDRSI